jgi:GGDEF domain-containing protein
MTMAWLENAKRAVAESARTAPPVEPLKAALVRIAKLDPSDVLAFWQSRTPGTLRSDARYRWELSHRIGVPAPAYAGPETTWRAWRAGDQVRLDRDPFEFEKGLLLPVVLGETAELLIELASTNPVARELLDESAPIFRRDFARYVQAVDSWEDTFALWVLTRLPRALALLHPVAVAIAACYAATADGPLRGVKFPFHEQPLVSANAQLASALLALGSDLERAAHLAELVREARRPSGAWGDASEPDDALTTLVAADLLARIDPSFDPTPTLDWFRREQSESDRMWRALGPDAPWLTHQIVTWAEDARRPFADRFRWPHRAEAMRDHKTGLPFFAYFAELAELFARMPGLAGAETEMAFIDLIGFRAFNNQFGQTAGDDVLRELATELATLSATCTVRDGGDEYVVVGAPTRTGLRDAMDTFRREAWPRRFRTVFGANVPPVAPRILVTRTSGRDLRQAREDLGRGITSLKHETADPVFGVLVQR